MLVIREAQLDEFPGLDPEFEADAIDLLRELFPELDGAVTDLEARRFLRQGAASAADYGLEESEHVLLYVSFMFLFGPTFDELPWAQAILCDDQLGPAEKMDSIYEIGANNELELIEQGLCPPPPPLEE